MNLRLITFSSGSSKRKTTIFENYCDFLNYFDSSISVQLSFINQQVDVAEFEKSIDIPDQNDDFNAIREEYRTMLKNQLSKGNNGLVKTKYITFGIEAESLKVARPRLERIETDILNNECHVMLCSVFTKCDHLHRNQLSVIGSGNPGSGTVLYTAGS